MHRTQLNNCKQKDFLFLSVFLFFFFVCMKPAIIGLLGTGTAAAQSQWTAAFVQRMRELGWVEGRDLAIEYRWAEGRTER